mmetsp:Transcript_5182/g.8025  ORF Transcript_5182/g.8025 Transcript_5182/m.8025 type:complete len:111 (+) Transcript_5182:370-702(+)
MIRFRIFSDKSSPCSMMRFNSMDDEVEEEDAGAVDDFEFEEEGAASGEALLFFPIPLLWLAPFAPTDPIVPEETLATPYETAFPDVYDVANPDPLEEFNPSIPGAFGPTN